jgi:RNA polymerase sigma factor (TIGR02999 family)
MPVAQPAPDDFEDLTRLLKAAQQGDRDANERFALLTHEKLKAIARQKLRGEAPGHSLQASALVNEAWIRLFSGKPIDFADRAHFFHLAASVMRRILVDNARRRKSDKRGGDIPHDNFDEAASIFSSSIGNNLQLILEMDEALTKLAALNAEAAEIVQLRFFGGYEIDEIAEILGINRRTFFRRWQFCRTWLTHELGIET